MSAQIPISTFKPYQGEKARLVRAYDYLILVLALFLFIGSFHLHFALTVGDWDFWVDWKDRQWWPLVTPLIGITFPAAVQAVLWDKFRLPLGATLCVAALLLGTWVTRVFAYHYWNYFPINMVLPATMVPGALVLNTLLMLTNSLTITSIFGGAAFALLFYPTNWPIFGMFHQPVEYANSQLTVADLFGFQYIRTGMPEYLRIIERGTLRTYGQYATPLSAFCSALLCSLMYPLWWHIGKWFASNRSEGAVRIGEFASSNVHFLNADVADVGYKGISLPLTLAVFGPFMILVSVGFNEWGHTFWFREEFFAAPIHWGFVIGVWFALGVGGILLQVVTRLIELLDKIEDAE